MHVVSYAEAPIQMDKPELVRHWGEALLNKLPFKDFGRKEWIKQL